MLRCAAQLCVVGGAHKITSQQSPLQFNVVTESHRNRTLPGPLCVGASSGTAEEAAQGVMDQGSEALSSARLGREER